MKNNLWIVTTCLHVLLVSANKPSISWQLETKPVILGQDIVLICVATECFHETTKHWMGGPNYSTLAFNGTSKSEKYRMSDTASDDGSFSLTIQNVTLADLASNYTCTCGMKCFDSKINISYSEIVVLPSKDMVKYHIEELDNVLELNFTLENVSPPPNCIVIFQDQHIETDVTEESFSNDIMKDIKYRIRVAISKEGYHRLQVECRSAGHDVLVIDKVIECKIEQGFSSLPFVIGGCIGVLGLLISVALFTYCVKSAKYRTILKNRNDIPCAGNFSEGTYISTTSTKNYGYKYDIQTRKQLLPS